MSDIKVYMLDEGEADKARDLMLPMQCDALRTGLPIAAFAAAVDGTVAGTIAGAAEAGVFEIHSLFVEPSYRRRGAGTALVEKVSEYTDEMDLGLKVEYTLQNDDNKTLEPFFLALGFIPDPVEYPMYCLGRLENLSVNVRATKEANREISPFFQTPERLLRAATARSLSSGFPLPEGGLLSERTDKDLSFCAISGEKVKSYIAVEPLTEDMVRVSALWSELNDPREMVAMISHSLQRMRRRFAGDTKIAMLALNPLSYKIIEHICGKVERCSYRFLRKY